METHYNHVFSEIIDSQQRIATYLNRIFSVTSNRVNIYVFILYDYYSNCILAHPMKDSTDKY